MEISTIISIGLIINGTGFLFIILILMRILAMVKKSDRKSEEKPSISHIIKEIKEISMKEIVADTIKIIAAILTIMVMILSNKN